VELLMGKDEKSLHVQKVEPS